MGAKQSLHARENAAVVIDDENGFLIWQTKRLLRVTMLFPPAIYVPLLSYGTTPVDAQPIKADTRTDYLDFGLNGSGPNECAVIIWERLGSDHRPTARAPQGTRPDHPSFP